MRYPKGLAATFPLLAIVAAPTALSAADAPQGPGQVKVSGAMSRDVLDIRAAHLARAALEGEQVETFSREELVSLFLLISLDQSKRHPS